MTPEDLMTVISDVALDLSEHFAELDDGDEQHLGEYARVKTHIDASETTATLTVLHQTEDWGIEIVVRRHVANGGPGNG